MADADDQSPFPAVRYVIRLRGDFAAFEAGNEYRSKASGYQVERTEVAALLDRNGAQVELRWAEDWSTVAPGIETRREDGKKTERLSGRTYERVKKGAVRIRRDACPVHLQVVKTWEYNDYDNPKFSTSTAAAYWIRYEAPPGAEPGSP